jgi:2-methylaconitate cis-trans-isomerase PrpF
MGSPDPIQIDGLGGSRLITSKIAIIKRSSRPDADVDYTFAQVDPARGVVAYDANCGNISAGVGPFAVDERLVEVVEPQTVVRIFNTNTGKVLVARVPVREGKAAVTGNTRIPGVPGSGAEVFMDYTGSIGAKTGRLLPTGRAVDVIDMQGFGRVPVTLCDAANPAVFVAAADIGLTASEHPAQVDGSEVTIQVLRELRGKAAELLGFCSDWRRVDELSPNLPMVMFVAPPADYVTSDGAPVEAAAMDLRARFVFFNRCHESMAGTGSMCIAAASRIPGSVVHRTIGEKAAATGTLRIGHPLGVMTVQVDASAGPAGDVRYERLGFTRTARRIMAGQVYVPRWEVS